MGALDSLMEKYGDDLNELKTKFESSGLGDNVRSWIGTGENDTITAEDVKRGLGQDEIDRLAEQSGRSADDVASELSRDLPRAVDETTPTGQIQTPAGRPTV